MNIVELKHIDNFSEENLRICSVLIFRINNNKQSCRYGKICKPDIFF